MAAAATPYAFRRQSKVELSSKKLPMSYPGEMEGMEVTRWKDSGLMRRTGRGGGAGA